MKTSTYFRQAKPKLSSFGIQSESISCASLMLTDAFAKVTNQL